MKYALIGWNDKQQKRGAYTEAAALQSKYPDILDVFDANTKLDINKLHQQYNRLIYTYQNPNKLYSKRVLDVKYFEKDIVYIRKDIKTLFKYKTTNSFSMYRQNQTVFNNFVPMLIPMFSPDTSIDYNTIKLGYYLRPQYRPDDYQMFCDFIYNIQIPVDLYVMGSFVFPFNGKTKLIKNLIYTTDNNIFFNNITHYVYSMSNVFDPWPTTLQEAVNANKQIIILKQNRSFKDGIDDIMENIKYHTKLDTDVFYNNSNSIINTWNYDKFYKEVFENEFLYNFDVGKYKYFSDWLSQF